MSEQRYRNAGKASEYPHNDLSLSKYAAVDVFLIRWAADDLEVGIEVTKLEKVFRTHYNFGISHCILPDNDPEDHLTREIISFRKGKGLDHLIILYYAGHAGGTPSECIWAANRNEDTPTLNFHNVQGLLLGHKADLLVILDCCFATLAANSFGQYDNWFLGSSTKESPAAGVSHDSFTSAFIRALKRHAQRYWANDKRFTVQSIHSTLIAWDRDLKFTPSLVRLSEHESEATELTPLIPRRRQFKLSPANTDPNPKSAPENDSMVLPPQPQSKTNLPSDSPVNGTKHSDRLEGSNLPITLRHDEVQTIRLTGLPPLTGKTDILDWFEDRLDKTSVISSIGSISPIRPSGLKSTTVTFTSVAFAKQALAIQQKNFRAGGYRLPISIDSHFQGLTCLYSCAASSADQPTVDLVFVHGTRGHAVNSFASHYVAPPREVVWPCSKLPKILEASGIFPRIMTFGWNAEVWFKADQDTQHDCRRLVNALNATRTEIPRRPIVFFAHGVGGLLVKEAIRDIINFGFSEDGFENPIKACFFFSAPNHGLDGANDFAAILANMQAVLRDGKQPDSGLKLSLKPLDTTVKNLSTEFLQIRSEYGFSTVSFYEQEETAGCLVVPKESAILDERIGKGYAIKANHQNLARLPESSRSLDLVLEVVHDTLLSKLGVERPTVSKQVREVNKEKVFARLGKYDTVFLVDDSDSMKGQRWTTTSLVLAKIATIAVNYDKNGVDIRFFNKYFKDSERKNLDSSRKLMDMFRNVEPDGPTLTADLLEEELSDYMHEIKKDWNRKGLNLIVLTDGEPDRGQKVENVIVKYAKMLEKEGVSEFKVGIQFVQIGGDEKARKFLKDLDNGLMERHGLDRDVGPIQARCASELIQCRWSILYYGKKAKRIGCTKRYYSEVC